MKERQYDAYDVISIGRDTRKNLEDNKHLLAPFEMVISTDTNDLLYKDEQGNLGGFFGSSGDINDQIKGQVDANTVNIQSNFEAIGVNSKHINDLKIDKLDKGAYTGTAEDLSNKIAENKNIVDSDLLGKLDRGNFSGTADDIINSTLKKVYIKGGGTDELPFENMFAHINDSHPDKPPSTGSDGFIIQGTTSNGYGVQIGMGYDSPDFLSVRSIRNGTKGTWGSIFTELNCPISKAASGYCKLANGMIMQWGRITFTSPADPLDIHFPISFTGGYAASYIFDGIKTSDRLLNLNMYNVGMFLNYMKAISNCASNTQFTWIAIGY